LLVLKKFGQEVADSIEWSSPRLLCIAGDFTKYDAHAVQQINRNIELLRYLRFGEELLLLELVNAVQAADGDGEEPTVVGGKTKPKQKDKTVSEQLALASQPLVDLYEALKATCLGFGDDVQMKTLKLYIAFKRLKNFVSVEVRTSANLLVAYVKVDPDAVELVEGFTRDVRNIGHWGTGDLEITLRNRDDLEKAMSLLAKSYEVS
jgi:predicted transport protein